MASRRRIEPMARPILPTNGLLLTVALFGNRPRGNTQGLRIETLFQALRVVKHKGGGKECRSGDECALARAVAVNDSWPPHVVSRSAEVFSSRYATSSPPA